MPPQLDSDRRCHAILADGGRCSRWTYVEGWCFQHHPAAQAVIDEAKQKRERVLSRRAVILGAHDFWCQVAICALLMYIDKVAPEAADALRRRLR